MHIWELLIRDENTGATLIVQTINPVSGQEGGHMGFRANPNDQWLATGTYKSLCIVKDGQVVAEYTVGLGGNSWARGYAKSGVLIGCTAITVHPGNWLKTTYPMLTSPAVSALWYPLNPNTYPQGGGAVRSPIQADKWEILIESQNHEPLMCKEIRRVLHEDIGHDLSVSVDPGGSWYETGHVGCLTLLRNGVVMASVEGNGMHVAKGSVFSGGIVDFPANKWCLPKPMPAEPVCTCGGWAVYGRDANIHADDRVNQCELRKAGR